MQKLDDLVLGSLVDRVFTKGLIKLDDTLRERTDTLQAQRQALLVEIARVKSQATLPFNLLQQKHIEAFTAVAGNLDTPSGVPRFVPKWLPDQGSNLGPAD